MDGTEINNTGNQSIGIRADARTITKGDAFGAQTAEIIPANLQTDLSRSTGAKVKAIIKYI